MLKESLLNNLFVTKYVRTKMFCIHALVKLYIHLLFSGENKKWKCPFSCMVGLLGCYSLGTVGQMGRTAFQTTVELNYVLTLYLWKLLATVYGFFHTIFARETWDVRGYFAMKDLVKLPHVSKLNCEWDYLLFYSMLRAAFKLKSHGLSMYCLLENVCSTHTHPHPFLIVPVWYLQ